MTVPTHLRVVFRGIFVGTPETWSFGLKFSRDNTVGLDASLSDVDTPGMKDAWVTFAANTASKIPNNVKLMDVRSYIIGTDGKMEGNPEIVDVSALNLIGATALAYPPQVCVVMTHVGPDRGPARFGRAFLPTAANINGTDSRMTTTVADGIRTAYTTFVKTCSDKIDLEVASSAVQLNISNVGAGARQTVDHHEIGLVFDTLRSRRRAMLEERRAGGHIDW